MPMTLTENIYDFCTHTSLCSFLAKGSEALSYEENVNPNLLQSSIFFVARTIYGLACFSILPVVGGPVSFLQGMYNRDCTLLAKGLFDLAVGGVGIAIVVVAFKLSLTIIPMFYLLSSMTGTASASELALTTGSLILRLCVVALPICSSIWYANQKPNTFD